MPTRKILSAKGCTTAGEMDLTRLKLAAKKTLVPITARCAFVFVFTTAGKDSRSEMNRGMKKATFQNWFPLLLQMLDKLSHD
jgi:hypothetical protein